MWAVEEGFSLSARASSCLAESRACVGSNGMWTRKRGGFSRSRGDLCHPTPMDIGAPRSLWLGIRLNNTIVDQSQLMWGSLPRLEQSGTRESTVGGGHRGKKPQIDGRAAGLARGTVIGSLGSAGWTYAQRNALSSFTELAGPPGGGKKQRSGRSKTPPPP